MIDIFKNPGPRFCRKNAPGFVLPLGVLVTPLPAVLAALAPAPGNRFPLGLPAPHTPSHTAPFFSPAGVIWIWGCHLLPWRLHFELTENADSLETSTVFHTWRGWGTAADKFSVTRIIWGKWNKFLTPMGR